jgi:hypothetical protein
MPTIFEVRKDSIVQLKTLNAQAVGAFDQHLLIIPVKIGKSAVETLFIARRSTDIIRSTARNTNPPLQPSPGSDLFRAFGNLKLTLGLECVRARERGAENHLDDIVWHVLEISQRRAVISLTTPTGFFADLTQLNNEQELNLRGILDKLNHGEVRDRVDDI